MHAESCSLHVSGSFAFRYSAPHSHDPGPASRLGGGSQSAESAACGAPDNQAGSCVDRSCRKIKRHGQTLSPFPVFPSLPLRLRSPASPAQIAHEIRRQLSVLSSIRSCKRLHNLRVMMQHLPLFPRHVGHSFLAINQLRLRGAVLEILNPPSFVRGAMNSARGRRFNAMF